MSSIRYTLLTLVFILSSFNVYSQDISVHPWVGVGITDLEGNPLDQSVFGRDIGWAGGAKLELSGKTYHRLQLPGKQYHCSWCLSNFR